MIARRTLLAVGAMLPMACAGRTQAPRAVTPQPGVTRIEGALDRIVAADAVLEWIGAGYGWAEGPVWIADGGYLLFTDVPGNVIWRWQPGSAPERFLDPSGPSPIPDGVREAGANGLAVDRAGRLLMAGSGSRAIERYDLATKERTVLAERFQGRRFNSCNDLVVARDGTVYFTDPPYGLAEGDASPLKEMPFNGVYQMDRDGIVSLVDDGLARPNGIALSPDQRTLYVAQSDPAAPHLYGYALGDGRAGARRLIVDFSDGVAAGLPGLPDGLKVASDGTLFATAPGGVHVLAPDGRRLGLIATGKAIANCALAPDGWLYLASSDRIARIRTRARPA